MQCSQEEIYAADNARKDEDQSSQSKSLFESWKEWSSLLFLQVDSFAFSIFRAPFS